MKRHAALLGLCAICAGAQPTVFQSETRVVVVDAIVTNKKGEYVRDLAAKDFRIQEDNKEQPIRGFSRETEAPQRLVLFFDFTGMATADQAASRQAAMDFIDAALAASEPATRPLLAVAALANGFTLAQSFTSNAERLKEAVARLRLDTPAAGGTPVAASARELMLAAGNLARNLGALPGRKVLVLFAGDSLLAGAQGADVAGLAPQFNRSNVALHPIVSRVARVEAQESGAAGIDCDQRRPAPRNGLAPRTQPCSIPDDNGLNALAARTGGFAASASNDLRAQLRKIAAEQREYYALSYTPPASKGEACHALRVKVDRKDIAGRARSSYCPQKAQDILAQTRVEQELEKHAAATGNSTAAIAAPFFYSAPHIARVHVAMEIPAEALKAAEVNVLGIAAGPDGAVAARFSDIVRRAGESSAPLHYKKEFRITPGNYKLAVVFSSGGYSFGKVEAALPIDPRNKDQLAISGIALGNATRPASEIGLFSSLVEQGASLVAHGTQLIPAGSLVFVRGEQAFCYFEIYAAGTAPISMRARILDPSSGQAKWDGGSAGVDRPSPGADKIPVEFSLPIASLPSGVWTLEITTADTADGNARRTIAFKTR